ncbi:hypothetical protein HDR58_08370, partial [bacterium]|nr:hypothetical protein [bacterium]
GDTWTAKIVVDGGTLNFQDLTNANGALEAKTGNVNITGGTLELASGSSIADAVTTKINGGNVDINGGSLVLSGTKDSWAADSLIKLTNANSEFDYGLTSNGKLQATNGKLNILNAAVLTLVDSNDNIGSNVDLNVVGTLNVQNGTTTINNGDSWSGTVTVSDSGNLNIDTFTGNGVLKATGGNLSITDSTIDIVGSSSIIDSGAVTTLTNSTLNISEKGKVVLDKTETTSDIWSADSHINLGSNGTLEYGLDSNGTLSAKSGKLTTTDGSTLTLVGKDSYIKSDVTATINGNLVIGDQSVVDLGDTGKSTVGAKDTLTGNVTVNNGGTLNVFNDLNFKTVNEGETNQLITVNDGGVLNLETTKELHLYSDFAGDGLINKNGQGNVHFHGNLDKYTNFISINNGGDLLFEQGFGGNLEIAEKLDGQGLTIGIHSDEIKGNLIQERDITMKYSTYHDNIDLNLANDEGSKVEVTRGAIIAESKGKNNINFGGTIEVNTEKGWKKPVSMTATSKEGSINFNNTVTVANGATLNLTSGVASNFAKAVDFNGSTINVDSGNSINFEDTVTVVDTKLNLTSGSKSNFNGDVDFKDSTVNLSSGKSANFNAKTNLTGTDLNILSGDVNFNRLVFNGIDSTIHDMNWQINSNTIENLDIYNNGYADFTVDINGRDWKHDKFVIGSITDLDGGQINVSDWQFADDWKITGKAPIDRHIIMNMFDLSNVDKQTAANINFTQTDKEIFTPIGWYKLENYQKWNKELGMFESVPGVLQSSLSRYNPQVFRGQVATLAMHNNQLLVNDMLTNHVGLQSSRFLNMDANKYALNEGNYVGPYQYTQKDGGLWIKNFASFEKLSMTQNLRVGNNFYGTLIGADMPVIDLKQNWKLVPTAYIGYNGAHQYFDNVSMYQNGGQLGMMGTFMKDNFVGSILAYAGGYFNDMHVSGYKDDAANWYAGTAAKAAYNFHPTKHFTVQPNAFVSYNFFGKQSWYTNYGQMAMNSGVMNGVSVAPGLNLIYARETWSMYATFQYLFNINDDLTGRAGNVILDNVQMKHGYFQYGIGLTKTWKDRLNSYGQLTFRNGGRTGIGFQIGCQYYFDWFKFGRKKQIEVKNQSEQIKVQEQSKQVIKHI